MDYKQMNVTLPTAEKIDAIKKAMAERGTPMQAPAIIGEAINQYERRVLGK